MRVMIPHGRCFCCGTEGPVCHSSYSPPLDLGGEPRECDLGLPDLCDDCDYAQRRWEAWEYCRANPGVQYPYWPDGPPQSPPVRR